MKKIKIKCQLCSKKFLARPIDLKRGWALHCSKNCAASTRELEQNSVKFFAYKRIHYSFEELKMDKPLCKIICFKQIKDFLEIYDSSLVFKKIGKLPVYKSIISINDVHYLQLATNFKYEDMSNDV